MSTGSEENVFQGALRRFVRPLLRFCLRHHLKHSEIAEVIRRELVAVAIEELQRSGERWNTSRLSVMTGLHRREIERITHTHDLVPKRVHLLNRLVGQWLSDPRFCTARGKPRALPESGDDVSFRSLVEEVSRELNPSTVLFELERSGLVARKGNRITLQREAFIPRANTEQIYQLVGNDIESLLSAAEENLLGDEKKAHLHLTTSYDNIDPKDAEQIKRWVIDQGFRFHEKLRRYLSRFDRDFQPKRGGGQRSVDSDSAGLEGEEERHEFSVTTFSFDSTKSNLQK